VKLGVVGLALLGVVAVLFAMNAGDLARYMKMRNM
jgi:Family of unknown function (DUF6893)